ncbi:DUF488 domain-containing protein [Planomonospora parontospora]|uniref:DUF488 domain-containing protein n=1 Tax=Planomonospora parontospora TaxID=58119 RepID=UPI00166FF1AB|nr:DUF488 domain-containing protein [Planomonospora parontospora]GGL57844.1 hypothetical protein GCM10014719_69080 [Planomonospora parontospora subsp. antibiotica]GII20083.1 hypothetical protein Ppa05_68090 [Planomonospora parontospora subsp. antibiotica]
MKIFTIGFTKKTAEQFFGLLREAGVATLVDVRLNNVSQLAGFAKRDDLKYFLGEICDVGYSHRLDLAPTQTMLDDYKKHGVSWAVYEDRFLELMKNRRIEEIVPQELLGDAVLLCSEDKAHHCHRRLVAEYLAQHWSNVTIEHLG